jgi:hypothetical protein
LNVRSYQHLVFLGDFSKGFPSRRDLMFIERETTKESLRSSGAKCAQVLIARAHRAPPGAQILEE